MESVEFLGKSALVTGASQQMGRMVAQALASAGARVGLVGRSLDRLRRTRASLGDAESYIYQADLRSEEAMVDLVQQVKDNQGTVDYLIHIASAWHNGTTSYFPASFVDTPRHQINEMMEVGLRAPILLTHMLLPDMVEQGFGRVIVTSDLYDSNYSVAEWISYYHINKGIEGFTFALGTELRPLGITVNCIATSYIGTESIKRFFPEQSKTAIPPEYAVKFLMYLLSSAGDHITGQTLGVRSKDAPLRFGIAPPEKMYAVEELMA